MMRFTKRNNENTKHQFNAMAMVKPKKKSVNSPIQRPLPLTTTIANGRNVVLTKIVLEVDIRILLLRCLSHFIGAHTVQAYRSARPARTLPCNHKTDAFLVYYPSPSVCVCVCVRAYPSAVYFALCRL